MTLGQKIQSLREQQNLSQKELATLADVTTGIIAEWESDEAVPSLSALYKLSKALSVPSDILLETAAELPSTSASACSKTTVTPAVINRTRKYWIISALLLVVLIVVAVLALGRNPKDTVTPTESTTVPTEPLAFSDDTYAIETADASVVTIFCYDYEGKLAATGSGFVAFNSKTIITNYHVMTSAYTCKISTNQDITYDVASILAYSKEQDIAILQLAKDTGLQPLTLGNSTSIKKGETVVAIGSPLGIKNTVSTGILSGRLMEDNMDVLQFTAPISSGSSGGALFDNNGNVIGITYASYIDGQNLNLAIPIELAVELYRTKGAVKKPATIYLEIHPYVAFLEEHPSIPEVTLTDLKLSPELYDDKIVKLVGYISSFYPDPDGDWEYSNLFVSNAKDVTFYAEYDFNIIWNSDLNFENIHCIECNLLGCIEPNEYLQEGTPIVVIGKFRYTAAGEYYSFGSHSGYRDRSRGEIDAQFVYTEN